MDGTLLQLPPLEILECHRGSCYCIAIDPLEKHFATGAADAIVAIWDLEEMICVRTYTKLEGQIRQLSFSFDGKYIATASEDELVDILAVDTGLFCAFLYNFINFFKKSAYFTIDFFLFWIFSDLYFLEII